MPRDNTKDIQRKAGIRARKSLDKEAAEKFSRIISERLITSPYAGASVIFSYQPSGGEVDLSFFNEWARLKGKKIAYPICHENGKMVAALPDDAAAWETGKYGIRTPVESRSEILAPAGIELVIVPCAAFHGGRRMRAGMGAGYYDRYLPLCEKAVKIAVAYEAQRIEDLQVDEWDVPLDFIVTEGRWY